VRQIEARRALHGQVLTTSESSIFSTVPVSLNMGKIFAILLCVVRENLPDIWVLILKENVEL
jgi:hypothetical protein